MQTEAKQSSALSPMQGKSTEKLPEVLVAYFRVSTQRQGVSGLGLDAQRRTIRQFASDRNTQVIAEYTEVETGTNKRRRPVLDQAIQHCRQTGARLVIAKLDRLARNVSFTSKLMEEGLKFTACDMPEANEFMVHVMAAFAQHESKAISERTRKALGEYKARGGLLGCARPDSALRSEAVRRKGSSASGRLAQEAADSAYGPVQREIRILYRELGSYRSVARELNARGRVTRNRKAWNNVQVRRVLQRFE